MFEQKFLRKQLYSDIVDYLQKLILEGHLKPGDKLPSERELCDQFGVSRWVLREAIKVLSDRGLILIQPGRGSFIKRLDTEPLHASLDLLVQMELASMEQLVQVRDVLEIGAIRLAVQNAQENHIRVLEELVKGMDNYLDSLTDFVEADLAFHRTLFDATGNPLFLLIWEAIVQPTRRLIRSMFVLGWTSRQAQVSHKQVLAAIRDRNEAAAIEAMQAGMQIVFDGMKQVHKKN
jgi:GntR family transcriptional regulator, transcriptional repressor for pyruvate dehydrogenase complex